MPQFLLGFWCGCLFSAVVGCWIYYFVRKKKKQSGSRNDLDGKKRIQKKETLFFTPMARILLVDDSKLSRKLIRDFLKGRPIEIEEAESGAECIFKCKRKSFDLIFLDKNMPGGSGIDILERLQKEQEGNFKVPVIIMGSNVRQESEEMYLKLGFAGCLAKPIQMGRLEELLFTYLSNEAMLQIPSGFSYENGLANFDGNDTVYRETLLLFSSLWEERKEQLQRFLDEENMEEYAILIHAIKGDARTLGADLLADLSYEQELSAKAGNAEAVRNGFAHVIKLGTDTAEYFVTSFSS